MLTTKPKHIIRSMTAACVLTLSLLLLACERDPVLHLHYDDNVVLDLPLVELELDVYWDYIYNTGVPYDWRSEWYYGHDLDGGWDETDKQVFGELGYSKPDVFNIRRYHTGETAYAPHTKVSSALIQGYRYSDKFDWGFWDILAWNDIVTIDGVQSLVFDEQTTLDRVTAYTNQTMHRSRYQAPRYNRSFYQPEALYSAYSQAVDVHPELKGFVFDEERGVWVKAIDMLLEPCTYVYLTQLILHNNRGRVAAVDGTANLSGMARSVNLNTGVAGSDAITVHYNVRLKKDRKMGAGLVDVIGGRLMTFGMCNINANRVEADVRAPGEEFAIDDDIRHYMDVNMQFNNGLDSTLVFDVTDQVQKRYKGGVLTVELDMDTVPIPSRSGGSGFDAVVKDYEDGGTHEFEM